MKKVNSIARFLLIIGVATIGILSKVSYAKKPDGTTNLFIIAGVAAGTQFERFLERHPVLDAAIGAGIGATVFKYVGHSPLYGLAGGALVPFLPAGGKIQTTVFAGGGGLLAFWLERLVRNGGKIA